MIREESNTDPIGPLAEEFVARYRRGERPALSEYAQRHPDLAERIRQVFPMMVLMEEAGSGGTDAAGPPGAAGENPSRLEQIGGYRIVREIGRGGMGVVYEAEQIALGRHVALKVLPLHAARERNRLERFRREARAAARLHHTNIVPVFEVGDEGDVCFYAMQFIHGQPLDDVLDELRLLRRRSDTDHGPAPTVGGPARSLLSGRALTPTGPLGDADFSLGPIAGQAAPARLASPVESVSDQADRVKGPPGGSPSGSLLLPGRTEASAVTSNRWHYFRSVARIGIQVADALEYAHREGIIHRDIKPSNLLLDLDGRVWVTDFGLAKTDDDALTQSGDLVGTIRYMAPERFRCWSDPRSDVYSLGLTLYEMLVLRPAFDTSDQALLVQQVLNQEPLRLRKLDPQVPRDLATIVAKAIDKEPARRYQSAAELASDLQRFLEDRPVQARQTTVRERAWRWCKRNRGVALFAAAFVLALLVGLAGVTWQWRRAQASADDAQANERTANRQRNEARQQQWESLKAQARAEIFSGQEGHRQRSLEALGEAARIRPSAELRDLAISSLALTDIRSPKQWLTLPDGIACVAFDARLERYARLDEKKGVLSIRSATTDQEELALRAPGSEACICFSPDGRYVAAFYPYERKLQVWDLRRRQTTLIRPTKWAAFVFTPDSRRLVVGQEDGSIDLHEVATGAQRHLCKGPVARRLAVSPDGGRLAVISNQALVVQVIDLETGAIRGEWPHPGTEVNDVAWHPHRRNLLATAGMGIYFWDERTGKLLAEMPGQAGVTTNITFSHGGDILASKGFFDTTVRLWDPWTGRQLVQVAGTVSNSGVPLQFSPDDRWLAFAVNGRQIGLWQLDIAREYRSLAGHAKLNQGVYTQMDISPDGGVLIASSRDEPGQNGVRFWDLRTGREVDFPPIGNTHDVRFHPAGEGFFTMQNEAGLRFWPFQADHESGVWRFGPARSLGFTGRNAQLSISGDGRRLAARSGDSITVLPVADFDQTWIVPTWLKGGLGRKARTWLAHAQGGITVFQPGLSSAGLALSPDGRWLATCDYYYDQPVRIWDARTLKSLEPPLPPVTGRARVEFSPDGKWLIAMGASEYRIYETGSWRLRHELKRNVGGDLPGPLAFRGDGQVMALSLSGFTVRLIDPATGRVFANLDVPERDRDIPSVLRFSPDGRRLAVCTSHRRMIHVWDLRLIGERLAEMGLPWELPPFEETLRAPGTDAHSPLRIEPNGARPAINSETARGAYEEYE